MLHFLPMVRKSKSVFGKVIVAKIMTILKNVFTFLRKHLNPISLAKRWWKVKGFKKWLLLVIFLVVVGVLANILISIVNKGKPDLGKYKTVVVAKQDVQKVITKEGVLRFAGVVDYPAPTSSTVTEIWVKNGDQVKKGQKLLSLESNASTQEQADAWNTYAAAKSAYETAQIAKMTSQVNLEAARKSVLDDSQARQNLDDRFNAGNRTNVSALRPDQKYTDNEIESIKSVETQARSSFAIAEREYKAAELRIQAAQAALNSSLWKYQLTHDAVIVAPVNGLLTNLNLQKGESVSSEDEILFRIVSSGDLIITLKASEAEVLQFQLGQESKYKASVYPDSEFVGKIVSVDTIGTEVKKDSGISIEYLVKIKPDYVDKKFLSPMTVDTDTVVEKKVGVLAVPNSAVNYSSGKRTVTLVKNGRTEIRDVTLGIITDSGTEITSGVTEGDVVLVPKASKI
jgi:RND family efflux transporter MFP subunit